MLKKIVSAWLILLASTALSTSLVACETVIIPDSTPVGITQTVPAISTPYPLEFVPTETPSPTPRPTDTLAPTEAVPDFYPGVAPTLEQFPLVDRADIPAIIAYLHTQPSLLSPNAEPITLSPIMTDPNGTKHAAFSCNYDEVNCSPAASILYHDMVNGNAVDVKALILEVKTKNPGDGRGYIAKIMYVGDDIASYVYYFLSRDPKQPFILDVGVYGIKQQASHPYGYFLGQQQPGLLDAMVTLQKTGVWTPEAEQMIWP